MKKIKNTVLIMVFLAAAAGAAFFIGQHYTLLEFKEDIGQINENLNELISHKSLTSPQTEDGNGAPDCCECGVKHNSLIAVSGNIIEEHNIFSSHDFLSSDRWKSQSFPHAGRLEAALEPGDYDLQKAAFLINNLMFVYSRDTEAAKLLWNSLDEWSNAVVDSGNYLELLGFMEWLDSAVGQLSGAVKGEEGLEMYMRGVEKIASLRRKTIDAAKLELESIKEKVLESARKKKEGGQVDVDSASLLLRAVVIESINEFFDDEVIDQAGDVSVNLRGLLTASAHDEDGDEHEKLRKLEEFVRSKRLYTEVDAVVKAAAGRITRGMANYYTIDTSEQQLEEVLESADLLNEMSHMAVLQGDNAVQAAAEASEKLTTDAWETAQDELAELNEKYERGKIDDSTLLAEVIRLVEIFSSYYPVDIVEQIIYQYVEETFAVRQKSEAMEEFAEIAERVRRGKMSREKMEKTMAELMVMQTASSKVQRKINSLMVELRGKGEKLDKAEREIALQQYQKWAFRVLKHSQSEIRNGARSYAVKGLKRIAYIDSGLLNEHMHGFYNEVMSEGYEGLDEEDRLDVYKFSLSRESRGLEYFRE